MSACPICSEPAIDRDLLAPCFDKMHIPGSVLHCPLCKQRVYESEVRKLYLYSLDQFELSESDKQTIHDAEVQSRVEFQEKYIKHLEADEIEMRQKIKELESQVKTLEEKQKRSESEKSVLITKMIAYKNKARTSSLDTQMLKKQVEEVQDYEAARRWMENHAKSVADLIEAASEGDQRCSRRLAVVLVTVRENYQKAIAELEATRILNKKLGQKNDAQQATIKRLTEEYENLKSEMKSLEAQRHVDPLPPKPTEKRREMSRVEMGRGGLFINTLESPKKEKGKRNRISSVFRENSLY